MDGVQRNNQGLFEEVTRIYYEVSRLSSLDEPARPRIEGALKDLLASYGRFMQQPSAASAGKVTELVRRLDAALGLVALSAGLAY